MSRWVSIPEACELLGKTRRQVSYMVKQGRVRAEKVGGRWRVYTDSLPESPGQAQARAVAEATAMETLAAAAAGRETAASEDTTPPAAGASGADGSDDPSDTSASRSTKRYTVQDLRSWKVGAALFEALASGLGRDHEAALSLRAGLGHLVRGYHAFAPLEKADCYRAARAALADATTALLLAEDGDAGQRSTWTTRLEEELLPLVGSLIRTAERRASRSRFDSLFGPRRGHR